MAVNKKNKNGQFTLEYVVLIIVVVGALLAMGRYMTRSVQAKYKQSADTFGEGEQYAKGVTRATNLDDKTKHSLSFCTRECQIVVRELSGTELAIVKIIDELQRLKRKAKVLENGILDLQIERDALLKEAGVSEEKKPDDKEKKRIAEIEKEINGIKLTLGVLRKQLQEVDAALKKAKTEPEKSRLKKERDRITNEILGLSIKLKKLILELGKLKEKGKEGPRDKVDLETDKIIIEEMKLDEKITSLNNKLSGVQTEISEKEPRLEYLEIKFGGLLERLSRLQTDCRPEYFCSYRGG